MARAFILEPILLLLDEPLADLDEAGQELLWKAIGDLSGSTVVIASPTELPSQHVPACFRSLSQHE